MGDEQETQSADTSETMPSPVGQRRALFPEQPHPSLRANRELWSVLAGIRFIWLRKLDYPCISARNVLISPKGEVKLGKTWHFPIIKPTDLRTGAEPHYQPMSLYIEANDTPTIVQNPSMRVEPSESLEVPNHCFQLAKAAEFLYHEVDPATIMTCIPKCAKRYVGRSHEKMAYVNVIEAHVKRMSTNVIKRGINIARMLVFHHVETYNFRSMMGQGGHAGIRYFKALITPDIALYVLAEQFKVVDPAFVFNEGKRANALEEKVRSDCRKIVFYGIALLLFDSYRYLIQKEAGDGNGAAKVFNEAAGIEYVRENYKQYTCWGPTKKVSREFGALPASPKFVIRKNIRKPKVSRTLGNGNTWTDSDSELD
ncbi:hypothetical protein V501_01712 [Pseudogymnoascus sp. VKM F-4519 (FW-2642)]|nr:hypothetical protein V501_01712 [Pseudogymnoascus sp. VKM F-4519 (FW-2642)]